MLRWRLIKPMLGWRVLRIWSRLVRIVHWRRWPYLHPYKVGIEVAD